MNDAGLEEQLIVNEELSSDKFVPRHGIDVETKLLTNNLVRGVYSLLQLERGKMLRSDNGVIANGHLYTLVFLQFLAQQLNTVS